MRRLLTVLAASLTLALGLTACAPAASEPVEVAADTIILDVRTASEYAAGHLDGAQLLDMNAGEVAEAIPTLDVDAEYLVYCKSGNRAGQAVQLMEEAGFTNVTNLGSLSQAADATGIAVVK